MRKLYELKETLCEKLSEYNGKEVTTSTLEIMEALSTTIKNIDKILSMDEEYSNRNYAYDDMSYGRRRRDSMGRYARDNYARDYSRDEMVDEMRSLANSLPGNQRTEMERLINKMQNM